MTTRLSPYFGLTITSLMLFVLIGCRRPYPQLPAEQLKLIQGIRTAANTENKQRVEAVKQAITNAIEAGEIPLETQELLRELLVFPAICRPTSSARVFAQGGVLLDAG